jgi:hypothetical protein
MWYVYYKLEEPEKKNSYGVYCSLIECEITAS